MIKNLAVGGSNRALLLLALLLGMVCAVLVGVYLSSLDKDSGGSVSATTIPVVVANVDIAAQTAIGAEMVTVKEIPEDLALNGYFTDPAAVVGKKTQVQIVAGQQILTTNAIDPGGADELYGPDAPLSLIIPEGLRAFSIFLSPVASVGGLARPGDRVDIVLSGESLDENADAPVGGVTPGAACMIMQDVEVLAVQSTLRRSGTGADSSAVAAVDPNPDAKTMTLAVTADQAVQLAAAQIQPNDGNVGHQVWVVLRPFGDHTPSDTPVCTVPTGV